MKKGFLKKSLAVAVTAATILGNAAPVLAASGDGTSSTGDGQGTSTGHLDTTYVEASVPTGSTIASIFSFYVDPENIIGRGGKFADAAVTPVADLVYFETATAGTYASTSRPLTLTIKNYEDVDVKVTATVDSDTTGLITFTDAASNIDNDLTADATATDALLYMALTVGSEEAVALTADEDGISSTASVTGQKTKFDINGTISTGYKAEPKTSVTDWSTVDIQMAGLAQYVKDATGVVAPKVTLTYSIALHQDNVAPTFTASTETAGLITVTSGAGNLALDSIESIEVVGYDNSTMFDIYNAYNGAWGAATFENGSIQITADALAGFGNYDTKSVTITYVNAGEETKTATVNLKFT